MRAHVPKFLALVISLPAVAGCEKTPRDKLQGRWLGEGIDNVSPSETSRATGWVKGTALEFSGSKVTVTIPAETPRNGAFKIAKSEGEKVTVSFLREEGGHDEAEFRFVGDQTLRWDIGGGREIVLLRSRN